MSQSVEEGVRVERRRLNVAAMLVEHRTYREMAAALDCSAATIVVDVKHVREEWRERYGADYATHVAEEVAKLDALEAQLWPELRAPAGVRLGIVDRLLAVAQRRSVLLGLNRPERAEVTVHKTPAAVNPDGSPMTLADMLSSAMRQAKAEQSATSGNGAN